MSVKTAGVGHFTIPTAPAAGTSCTSGAANVFTTTYVQLIASTAAALYITGIYVEAAAVSAATYVCVQLATGAAASETIVGQHMVAMNTASTVTHAYKPIFPPIPVANATRIACKTADSVGSQATLITLECIAQSNVVDDGIAVGTVTTVTNQLTAAAVAAGVWRDAVAADFTVASSIGLSVMNGVALGTGLTVNTVTNQLTAAAIAAGVWRDAVAADFTQAGSVGLSVMNGVALGTGLTVNTVTNQLTAATIAAGVWRDTVAADFTVALSIGKSVMNGVTLGTGLTVNDITTKTGYSLAAGQKVDVDTIKTQAVAISGAGTVTFPNATVASTTNITAASGVALAASQHVIVDSGTVTTLSNLPAIPAAWLTATGIAASALNGKGDWLLSSGYTAPDNTRPANFTSLAISVGGAVTAGTVSDKTGYALTTADWAKAGDAMTLTAAYDAAKTALTVGGYTAPDNTSIAAIKLQTDPLRFTVANQLDVNALSVNGHLVTGDGHTGTEWGPA